MLMQIENFIYQFLEMWKCLNLSRRHRTRAGSVDREVEFS